MRNISMLIVMAFIIFSFSNKLVSAETVFDGEYSNVVSNYLPKHAELVVPKDSPQNKPIQTYDFDKNGHGELIVTYKVTGEPNKLKVMVLKKAKDQWKKVWEITGEGFDIHLSYLADITGDGIKEYLVGWKIGASAGNKLEIFKWRDNSLEKIYDYSFYHKLETLKQNNKKYLAIWDRFCCDAYTVDVVGWNGNKMVRDDKMFATYYPMIKEFYKNKIKEMDAWFYWYALADAQIKANLFEEARLSIQKGFSFNLANKEFTELQKRMEKKQN